MSSHCRIVFIRLLTLCGAALPPACAAPGAGRAPSVREPTPAVTQSTSVSAAGSGTPSATAPTAGIPIVSASEALAPAPPATAEPTPPCIDGEIMMGACICDKGKSVDATGHCVYSPCPKSTTGGTSFRDETTGQCMECRAGMRPTMDGRCER